MKLSVGWLLFTILLLALLGAAGVAYQRDRASQALIAAVNTHDAPRVETLLNQGADPNVRDWKTYYPGSGVPFRPPWYEKYLAKLLHRKPRPADPYVGPTVLMIAAAHGDTALVKTLLDHGADPAKLGTSTDCTLNAGCAQYAGSMTVSPLLEAIENRQHGTEAALLLIQRGAPVNSRYFNGGTALMHTNSVAVIKALVNKGADINAADDLGNTALVLAVRDSDAATVQLLLEKAAHIDVASAPGGTPLMWVMWTSLSHQNPYPILLLLLSHGANVNARNRWGDTALIDAATARNLPAMKLLLLHGVDVNAQDNFGRTALMLASYARFPQDTLQWKTERSAMQDLLRHYGANSHLKNRRGKTAADYEHKVDPASKWKFRPHSASSSG